MARSPFALASIPPAYPGKHIWFTLRFVGEPPSELGLGPDWSWRPPGDSEYVPARTLAVGDQLVDGRIVARVEIAGQPMWKVDLGKGASQYLPIDDRDIERIRVCQPRTLQVEYEGDDFDRARFERAMVKLHARHPLVAVLFQDGQWTAGEPLTALDDAALVARLGS